MQVEILRNKLYRENALTVGQIIDMDTETAAWFMSMGWARLASEAKPMTTEQADAVVPVKVKRRRARL